jgi:predicted NBD/HSP70 family sugar kinase
MKKIFLQKAKSQIARPTKIRDINKQIVLNYVRVRSPISRAEIARETALQRSTVSSIVDDLQNIGLIEEIGSGESTGGRKPRLLKLKTGTAVAIGVDVTPRETSIAVADLAGVVLDKISFPTSSDADFMSKQIVKGVAEFAEKYNGNELGVGISVPGVTDQLAGKVLYVPYFRWQDWNVSELIFQKTGLNVTVENDANAIALAELWFGLEDVKKTSNFIVVLVAEGVGTGIVFDGQIYRGENGSAGEFGHMIVGTNSPVKCSCGSTQCWEGYASEKAIIARYKSFSDNNTSSNIDMNQIVDLAIHGEDRATKVLQETAKFLAIGISNLIVGLSPEAVIVSGRITKAWDLLANEWSAVAEKSARSGLPKTTLVASSLGDSPTLIGSLSLVLAQKFASAS